MRIRLTVQRNALPAAKILWTIPETNSTQAYTISRLLEDVNHVIPLESEHWGLEHYVVEIDGFECLHFSPVAETLKENDNVSIRPLLTAEVRARTLTGRDQITDDGRHLVDGIPFGRPYLRRPNRPDLRIPAPQETPAITSGSPNFELGPQHTELPEHLPAPLKGLLSGLDLLNPEDREEAQQNLTVVSVLSNLFGLNGPMGPRPGPNTRDLGLTSRLTHGESHATQRDRHNQTINGSRKVQFQMPEALEEDLDSEEDDEDFDPGDDGLEEDMEEEDENDTDSDSHSASSSASGTSSSDSESDSEDSSSDSDGESDASSAPEVRSSKGKSLMLPSPLASLPSVAPGKGRRATQARNERRTRTNRLRHLQQSGKLPSTATLKDLAEYETGMPKEDPADSTAHQPHSNWTGKRKRIDDEDKETNVVPHDHRKEALTKAFGEGIPSTRVELGEFQAAEVLALASGQAQPAVEAQSEKNAQEKETPRKRLRPDTSAISRILARQAAPSPKKLKKTKPAEAAPSEPEGASDPDFWKSRVNISAFECWDEEFELSAPPFPFKQHWDTASTLMREKVEQKKKGKKAKKVVREPEPSDEEEEKIILDYDDPPNAAENQDSEINAAIEEQLKQDVETAAQQDLPPLPEDVGSLPVLVPGELKKGAVIVCKFFDINPVTVAPEISDYKTAIVEHEGDSGNGAGTIRLKLAQRDLPKREKKFDKNGNQIYNAADQFFMDGENEEEGIWEGQFSELLESKLLQAA